MSDETKPQQGHPSDRPAQPGTPAETTTELPAAASAEEDRPRPQSPQNPQSPQSPQSPQNPQGTEQRETTGATATNAPAAATAPRPRGGWSSRPVRGRVAIAAAAVGLLLVGGFGGFALGATTDGGGERGGDFPGHARGFDSGRGGPPGFGGPGGGMPPERGHHQEGAEDGTARG